jgi:type IV pilus assembly protein PilB
MLTDAEKAIDDDRAAREEAESAGREFCDAVAAEPAVALITGFPPEGMKKWRFLPLRDDGGRLVVATPEWRNPLHRDEVERFLGRPVRFVACGGAAFDRVVDKWVDSARVARPASASPLAAGTDRKDNREEMRQREELEDSSPYVRTLNSLLIDAVQKGASDIHLEAEEGATVVRFRIDGVLISATDPIDISFHPRLVSRIKVISDLDISETRRSQDGRFQFTALGKTIDFRVSIIPAAHGEDVVIRILDKEHLRSEFSSLSLDRLGFPGDIISGIRRLAARPHGMFLVTGPTGSGKTTSLYAAIQEMDHATRKFVTIEDPVEYHIPGVVQIPVNEGKGVTFASGLRSVLRHDPDVVMVGEIRDRETAEVAVQAALTGHLVFSTVHANNSTDVILRFLHMGVEAYNFVSAVNGIFSQRLLRILCKRCRRPVDYTNDQLKAMGVSPGAGIDGGYHEAAGCADCFGTGYRGRMATGELVPFTEEIRDWMIQRRSFGDIRSEIRRQGVASIRDNALALARRGLTSIVEVNRVTSAEEG